MEMCENCDPDTCIAYGYVKGEGDRPTLSYALVSRNMDWEEGSRVSYSLICRADDEQEIFCDITSDISKAMEIFRLFYRNTVTLQGAYDVLEEIL